MKILFNTQSLESMFKKDNKFEAKSQDPHEDNQDCNQSEKKEETLGGNKASMSASEAAGKRSLTVRLSFFLSAPDSLWCDFASTAFLNIFCVSVSVCFAEPKAKSYV